MTDHDIVIKFNGNVKKLGEKPTDNQIIDYFLEILCEIEKSNNSYNIRFSFFETGYYSSIEVFIDDIGQNYTSNYFNSEMNYREYVSKEDLIEYSLNEMIYFLKKL